MPGGAVERATLFARAFAIDCRTLVAFRTGLAVILLLDVVRRFGLSPTLLSSAGVLDRQLVPGWGLLHVFDSPEAVSIVLTLLALAALALLVGLQTKAATILAWFLLHSVLARNPWSLDAGDSVLQLLLFWAIFLPLEKPSAQKERESGAEYVLSFAGVGLRLQLCVVYCTSVLQKLKGSSWRDGTAVAEALGQGLWARPLGLWIAERPELARGLNYLVLVIELTMPLLLLFPWRRHHVRFGAMIVLVGLQFMIGISLRMGLFPWIMTLALVPFLPGSVWQRGSGTFSSVQRRTSQATQRVSAALVAVMFLSALNGVLPTRWQEERLSSFLGSLGLQQYWGMYSPNPYSMEFGIRAEAQLEDGSAMVLDDGRGQSRWPPLTTLWNDYRGAMYLENITSEGWTHEQQSFARWVAWQLQREQPKRRVHSVRLQLIEWEKDEPDAETVTEMAGL